MGLTLLVNPMGLCLHRFMVSTPWVYEHCQPHGRARWQKTLSAPWVGRNRQPHGRARWQKTLSAPWVGRNRQPQGRARWQKMLSAPWVGRNRQPHGRVRWQKMLSAPMGGTKTSAPRARQVAENVVSPHGWDEIVSLNGGSWTHYGLCSINVSPTSFIYGLFR